MSRLIRYIGCLLALCLAVPSFGLTSGISVSTSSSSSLACAGISTTSAVSSTPAVPALTCNVRATSQWNSGYQIEVTVKNNSNVKIENWQVYLSVPEFHSNTSLWNATKTVISPTQIMLSKLSWSSALLPGQSVIIGAVFTKPLGSIGLPSCRTETTPPANTAPQGNFSIQHLRDTVYVKTIDALDAEGDKLTYRFDFGDGTSLVAPYGWHTYKTPGNYTITQTISDGKLTKVTQHQVTTTAAGTNRAPVAMFSYFTSGLRITVDARASTDRDGDELTYGWDFGHGVGMVSSQVRDTWTSANGYVTLTVFDGELGNTVQYRINTSPCVTADVPPQISASHIIDGNRIELDASESKNVDSFTWDFGDGSTARGMFVDHTYATPGTYTLSLRATAQMLSASKTWQIVIVDNTAVNLAPVAELSCREDVLVADDFVNGIASYKYLARCDASASYDPEAKPLNYSMNWGDGTSNQSTTGLFSHMYATGGEFVITLQVSDGETQTTKTLNWIATAPTSSNRPPVACFDIAAGSSLNANASCSTDPDSNPLTYAWEFGDGSSATGLSVTHNYSTSGSYPVKLTVSDGKATSSLSKNFVFTKEPKLTRCEFKITNSWNSGFSGWLRVHNQGTVAVSNWSANLRFSAGSLVSNFWNGTVTGTNPFAVGPVAWNNTIAPGAFVEVGFNLWDGTNNHQIPEIFGGSCD